MKDNVNHNKIEEVMASAMKNLRTLVDVDIVVGKSIISGQMTIVPLTKVTMGFVTGGGEYYSEVKDPRKSTEYPFSGGSGSGVSLKPIGFLIVKYNEVELLKIESKSAIERLIEAVPEVAKFLANNFSFCKNKDKNDKN